MLRALLLLLLLTSPALAEPIVGQATVIDGDTIEIHGQRIRLWGIDAPESRQLCKKADGSPYRCGQAAAFALADQIGRSVVSCEPRGRDRYRRVIGLCRARGGDLGRWMVEHGHALAFRRYSMDYVAAEGAAVERRAGMWQGDFVPPWEWRAIRTGIVKTTP